MNEWRFKLLYDGECPLCLREVRWLQRWNRHGHLAFEDISLPDFDSTYYHTTREELLGVIHGVFPDGRIVRKVEVFRQALRHEPLRQLHERRCRYIRPVRFTLAGNISRRAGSSCDCGVVVCASGNTALSWPSRRRLVCIRLVRTLGHVACDRGISIGQIQD
jgi:predicted DCC family thiol-disulfide oxidoreductase YuxK